MFHTLCRISAAALLLTAFVLYPEFSSAQIAPTTAATISGSVSDSTGKPVVNAKVSLSGPKSALTQTDGQGLFVFVGVPFGMYTIAAAAQGLGTATRSSVVVQGDVNIAIQYEPASVSGLKVIANVSTSANARFNVTPASVTQVNPIANAFEGKTSWRTILEQIPGVAQAGMGCGANLFTAMPDGPIMPVQISINGGLAYETSILLDDMPLIGGSYNSSAGSGTNLGLYPLNGFGSADVVRGPGASAPSIVDSIGGSFVLHAPGAVTQNQTMFSVSSDPYGGIVANGLAAVHWKKLSAVVTYGVNDSPGPTNSAVIPMFITDAPPLMVNGQPFSCTGACAETPLTDPNYSGSGYGSLYGYSNGLLTCCSQVSTAWTQHSGSVAVRDELSPAISAEIFYTGQSSLEYQPAQIYEGIFTPPAGYIGSVPAGQQYLPTNGARLDNMPILQTSNLIEEKISANIGTGVLQLAALQNRTSSIFTCVTGGTVSQQLFGSGTVGGVSTIFNGGTYQVSYLPALLDLDYGSNNRDLLASFNQPLGDNLRAGISFVRSYYDIPYNETYNIGAPYNFSGSASTPSAISETTNELRAFIGGNPSAKTSVDLSMYFANANYHVQNPNDLSGNTYVDENYTYAAPRLGFVWRPTAAIAIRASAGGGFSEAPLNDLVGTNAPFCFGGTCSVSPPNLSLQPEKSFGFDLGTDIRLRHNTVFSFDVYRTNLFGQLYTSTTTTGSCPICGGLPLYVTQYGNLSESRYEGVLLDVRHDAPRGIYWSLSGGLTRGYVVSVPAGFYNTAGATCNFTTAVGCANLMVVPGVNFNGTFTSGGGGEFGGVSVPYSQGLGTIGYRWNAQKYVDLVATYYGNNNTYFRPAFVEFDGHVGYPVTRNASLLITFRNITGIYDGSTQIWSQANLTGVPTVAGLPYALHAEEYGPRTVILTLVTNL